MVSREPFGTTRAGEHVDRITLRNAHGVTVRLLTLGGIISELHLVDAQRELVDVVLGYDTLAEYEENSFYFGALIGRNANRIANGHLEIDGERFALARNDGAHNLHGGPHGFHRAHWRAETFERSRECGVLLRHSSAAGDDGYPGLVEARVTYTLTDDDELRIDYAATTDTPTVVNLTQHSYWNLAGATSQTSVLDHELQIVASRFTPVDETLIPMGRHDAVDGTPFDLRARRVLGDAMRESHPQLAFANGYDHNFVLDASVGAMAAPAVRLSHPPSGRAVEMYTTEAGVQIYAGGTFTAGLSGKEGANIPRHGGIAIEMQAFPDAPNQPAFPSTILRPGERYESTTVWRFPRRG